MASSLSLFPFFFLGGKHALAAGKKRSGGGGEESLNRKQSDASFQVEDVKRELFRVFFGLEKKAKHDSDLRCDEPCACAKRVILLSLALKLTSKLNAKEEAREKKKKETLRHHRHCLLKNPHLSPLAV